jgi:hypothetical protein
MENREEWLATTLVELADTLVADFDLVELLSRLAERTAELVDAAEVGLVVVDARGKLRVMASSTERVRVLELFEVQSDEGPCLQTFRTGEPLLNQALDENGGKWPVFGPMARVIGFQTAHALPMRLRTDVIGAMNIFHADAATVGIMQERAVRRATDLAAQLQSALNTRIVIEQAKGVVAERLGVEVDGAFELLRRYARDHNRRLVQVATETVDGALRPESLVSGPRRK